ncbi:hypothetical protein B0H15DRAFT_799093 [Mycena belliarum]|uniref:Uncharacterized protein n=1 Tax=Mycena belliarum TaxID=1033014 RepID=A0AAD6UCC7_9AGAR|nr:hypothetical protein B0H15DRAFT_799093 [Mycena belliae]
MRSTLAAPDSPSILLLPVFFSHLDPTGIPTSEELAAILSSADPSAGLLKVVAAMESLNGFGLLLKRNLVPAAAYPDYWPRLSRWIIFVDTYSEWLPSNHGLDTRRVVCLDTLMALFFNPETKPLVLAAPGVRGVFARHWAETVRNGQLHMGDNAGAVEPATWEEMPPILRFLGSDLSGGHLEEILEAIHGDISDLAVLLVRQINVAVPRVLTDATASAIVSLKMIAALRDGDGPFNQTMLACGVIKSLLTALVALAGANVTLSGRQFEQDIQMASGLLIEHFRAPLGYM